MRKSKTRPRPVHGVLDQTSADRIAKHVVESDKEMSVLLDRKTLESTLPHMPTAPVMLMVAADVAGHPPLHEGTQRRVDGWLNDQMKVIRHETDAKELDGVFGFCNGEQVEKCGVVAVFAEDCRTTIPSIQDMVGVTGHLSAWNTRHCVRKVREVRTESQGNVACPLFLPL